ncbi:conserved hypothetical protein [Pedosphaera parvula Ellin514]|uniref:DUF2950 domain-containing protein n=2 Tax=Pedosphaera TaxID=1032526 RepID=B9XGS2_PEDPL|nr:conserved hypothetical protein [Pedosphaera parvula Ellin514]
MNRLLSFPFSMTRAWAGFNGHFLRSLAIGLAMVLIASNCLGATEAPRTFASPEEAVTALANAVESTNREAMHVIFGSSWTNLVNPDKVEARNEFNRFSKALNESHHLVPQSNTNQTLEVGNANWPFPVPIVQKDGRWYYDTDAGVEELSNRRIGEDELKTLKAVRAYVEAQREYASLDHDGSGVLKYAQKLISSPGKKDGLYWPPDLDGETSPLGPLMANAQEKGYEIKSKEAGAEPQPFQGYYYKILTRQGAHAPGGKYDYIINGNMIGGFALVAWPAEYGRSGIMTFVVNQNGRVYQKDLGPRTEAIVKGMKEYNPDKSWMVSSD